jgi:MFS family permease
MGTGPGKCLGTVTSCARVKQRSPLLPIFLIVLVDVLGFTIVIPLLAYYAEHFGASALTATTLVSVYAVCSLISTPVIGRLSDRYGRRALLLISQAGTCAGFLILAFSNALWMVFLGRILDGITAGNLSLAQAYISDHTRPENRAKAFGVIGIAFGIGFTFGPGIGGVLQKYGMHVPFVVAASLSALSIFCTYTLLGAEAPPQAAAPSAAPGGAPLPAGRRPGAFDIATYTAYFRRPNLGSLYIQFFLFSFAFSCFTSGFALFAERRFTTADGHPWTASEVGYLFTYSGVLGIILQGGILGRLVKRFGEAKLAIAGFLAAAVAYVCLGFAYTLAVLLIAATASAFGNGVIRPVVTSRITQVVGRHEQGVALGISGSLASVAMALAPPTGGWLIKHDQLVEWALVSGVAALLGTLVAIAGRTTATPASAAPSPELSSSK